LFKKLFIQIFKVAEKSITYYIMPNFRFILVNQVVAFSSERKIKIYVSVNFSSKNKNTMSSAKQRIRLFIVLFSNKI